MFKSIRYKLIILYFAGFIAMLIVGVFITDQFEKYHLNIVKDNLTYTANNVVRTMIKDVDLIENKYDIQENLIKSTISLGYEISIIEGLRRVLCILLQRLRLLGLYAAEKGLLFYVDGARLGYGLASPDADFTLADLAEFTDVFYIGGTKVGALFRRGCCNCK